MLVKKFLRRDASRFSKFGKGRGKKAKWKKPNGRDNKMREKRKGYQAVVSIGYRTDKDNRGKLEEKTPVTVFNVEDLKKVGKENIAILGKVGTRKKQEIAKEAEKLKIKIKNLNSKTYLKKEEKRMNAKSKKKPKTTEVKKDKKEESKK
jgi:large subunit ribosomal protein L32e